MLPTRYTCDARRPLPRSVPCTASPDLILNRIAWLLHADASDEIAQAFTSQGFMSSSVATLDALLRLIELHRPDVVIADFDVLEAEPVTLRSLCGVGVRLLYLSNPAAVDVVGTAPARLGSSSS